MKKFVQFKVSTGKSIIDFGDKGVVMWGPHSSDGLMYIYTGNSVQAFACEPSTGTSLADLQLAADVLANAVEKGSGNFIIADGEVASSTFELTDGPQN